MQPLDTKPTFRSALDRMIRASIGRMTMGISPIALAQAYQDWALHLCLSSTPWSKAERTCCAASSLWIISPVNPIW